jgi:hypothetical protein
MRIYVFFLLISLFSSCKLNADQEKSLNKSISLFINAVNNNSLIYIVAHTDSEMVKELKSKGNEVFQSEFAKFLQINLREPQIISIEKKNNEIQVKLKLTSEQVDTYKDTDFHLVVHSKDGGENWFFCCYEF